MRSILTLLLLLLPVCALAQEGPTANEKAAVAALDAMGMEQIQQKSMDAMMSAMTSQNPMLAGMEDVFLAFFDKYLSWEALKPEFVKLYAQTYTEAELKGLAEFYSSTLGKTIAAKMPELMVKSSLLGQEQAMAHMDELMGAVQQRMMEAEGGAEGP